jgi:MYXO-CTERM domain-containing protein
VRLNGTAVPGETFSFTISDIQVAGGTLTRGHPSALMPGFVIREPEFVFTDHTVFASPQGVPYGATGVVMQAFTVTYPGGPDNDLTLLHIQGLGTGHERDEVDSVQIWLDVNGDRQLDAGDTLIGSTNFLMDNGQVAFTLPSPSLFTAGQSRDYLIVYDFSANARNGVTFRTLVNQAAGPSLGTLLIGLPLPDSTGTPGVVINTNLLTFALVGPTTAAPVFADSTGASNYGELLAEIIVSTSLQGWNLTALTFAAEGTADWQTAYSELFLFEDSNGNGVWDPPPGGDTMLAGKVGGFDANGELEFTLTNPGVHPGQPRRFFLTAKLSGAARSGETMNARLERAQATTLGLGMVMGLPTQASTALVVDTAVMTVAAAQGMPATKLHMAGSAVTHPLALFRMTAANDAFTVSGFTFAAQGSADWQSGPALGTGVQVWLDDGDRTFDAATDTLLFQTSGGLATINALFTQTLQIPQGETRNFWVVLHLTDQAGRGAITPQSYRVAITSAADVNATGGSIVLGTPPPISNDLSVVEFFISEFTPQKGKITGGEAISIEGSGLMEPLQVTIGGQPCQGTATVVGGTKATGLTVPKWQGGQNKGLPIEIRSGPLNPITIQQTYTYETTTTPTQNCAAGPEGGPVSIVVALMALLGLVLRLSVVPRRRAL